MSSLFAALSISVSGLQAQQAGLEVTTNNLANMSTPGYSRQRPVIRESQPVIQGDLAFGSGVNVAGIESLRDDLLNIQIFGEMQQQAKSQAFINTMNQVQPLFPMDTSGIGSAIGSFFTSLNNLSTNASDLALRQNVLSAAHALASSFQQTAGQLTGLRDNLDLTIEQAVRQVNQLTQQIANINSALATTSSTTRDYGSFLDQRDQLIQQLSGLIDVSVIGSGNSLTLTTRQGAALVVDGQSFDLHLKTDPNDGRQHIFTQGEDVTGSVQGGKLGGLLEARDRTLPSISEQLDSLAYGLVENLNAAHRKGFDLQGQVGADIFKSVSLSGAAANMAVAFSDPKLLAASSDGSIGSNGNIANLTAVSDRPVLGSFTPTQAYSNLVFQVGTGISTANGELSASKNILQQLQQQASSVSGVSLDEEASNLLLYERAYQAAARAISTVDSMLQTVIHMGAGG